MNTNNIKKYAPKARRDFIAAMTKQAAKYGITAKNIDPVEQKGDLVLIGDRPFPAVIIRPRAALVKKIEQIGFDQAMEQAAYSWLNRLCAIRFMELKDYLDHGRRVLSTADGSSGVPQILDDCLDIEFEGLNKERITELKLDGTKDEDLYRELLLAQCHALHQSMPFLFEAIDDATELLLPDNLTKTNSLIRELVEAIPVEDWQDVEIIGWLYQYYISEKKDQVIGKVVKSEDIPAATQLFTPNWIVQYLVQNSVGRRWLQTHPDSPLRAKMPYYIAPADQSSDAEAKLAASTSDCIDPLTIKVLDPACGSGHILVEAYKLLREIYTERGFRSRDIPKLILENNLFGLDIDDRAGQLASFALMMLAREDDRRIFERDIKLNVLAIQESSHLDFLALWRALNLNSDWQRGHSDGLFDRDQSALSTTHSDNRHDLLAEIVRRFTKAKTFGSLIEVSPEDAKPLRELLDTLQRLTKDGDTAQKPAAEQLIPLVHQAWILAEKYDAVVGNPPYMGSKGMNSCLKEFSKSNFEPYKADIFSMFSMRMLGTIRDNGHLAFMTPFVWMFLSSFEAMRKRLLDEGDIISLVRPEYHAFFDSAFVPICAFVYQKGKPIINPIGTFIDLSAFYGYDIQPVKLREAIETPSVSWRHEATTSDFRKIPGFAIAYWLSKNALQCFEEMPPLSAGYEFRQGLATGNNDRFLRLWHECSINRIGFGCPDAKSANESKKRWFPCHKGGENRRWYGNLYFVVDWENDGEALKAFSGSVIRNPTYYFKEGATWGSLTVSSLSMRYSPPGFIFESKGAVAFAKPGRDILELIALANSRVMDNFLKVLSPTMDYSQGPVGRVPYVPQDEKICELAKRAIEISKSSWDSFEASWEFSRLPWIKINGNFNKIEDSWRLWEFSVNEMVLELSKIENENEKRIAEAYGLSSDLSLDTFKPEVTLTRAERDKDIQRLISYSIGCAMGRYSLDRDGLVYANSGNHGFSDLVADGAYKTFSADSDGIFPLTDQEWFADDASNRFREFVRTVWGNAHLQENLDFVAECLCLHAIKLKKGEDSLDTIRRYLSSQFYKDHLRTYKKRPIYWLFSSGKHKAFECLVYLHRYNDGTLARMRTEYVIPLTAKFNSHANKLEKDIDASISTAEKKALEKQLVTLHNQRAELATFDEKLRHFSDQRIRLDLDDGVKVNYGKFGDLLADVNAITGGSDE